MDTTPDIIALSIATTGQERSGLSVGVPASNEADNLDPLMARLTVVLDRIGLPYEIVVVDDCSSDATFDRLLTLHARDPRVKAVRFSRNFGKEIALAAGLRHARGAAVVLTDVGWRGGFDEGYQPWERTPFLKEKSNDMGKNIAGNFLNWDQVDILGYVTVRGNAKSGDRVSLDVTDWIDRMGPDYNIAVMRLVRHDDSPEGGDHQVPGDKLDGEYIFYSREADNENDRPKLFVAVRD